MRARSLSLGGSRELEVVVEAVLDCRADRHLGAGPEVLDGLGQHVRRGVPQHRERLGVADAQNAQVRAVGQRQAQVAELAVDLDRGRGVGQSGPDRPRGVQAARALGKVECGAVGEDRLHSPECRYPGQVAC